MERASGDDQDLAVIEVINMDGYFKTRLSEGLYNSFDDLLIERIWRLIGDFVEELDRPD